MITSVLLFLLAIGLIVVLAITAFLSRNMIRPPQQELWTNPAELDMGYENIEFYAEDGIRLSAWFIPAPSDTGRNGQTFVLAHGWLANRLGGQAKTLLARWAKIKPLLVLPLAKKLNKAGFHILMFDMRNHGHSASSPPVTFGIKESKDLLAALDYVANRQEVDSSLISVIGISMGANTTLFTLPQTDKIMAAIVAQPTSSAVFSRGLSHALLGPLGNVISYGVQKIYMMSGGAAREELQPGVAASKAGNTPVLFVQGNGDPLGTVDDVQQMVDKASGPTEYLVVDTVDRIGGYQYIIDRPEVIIDFYDKYVTDGI